MLTNGSRWIVSPLLIALITVAASSQGGSGETRSFKVSPGASVIFALESGGSVTVIGWDKPEAEVTYTQGGMGDGHVVEISEVHGDLLVESKMAGHGERSGSLEFEVYVPHEFDVQLESLGGSLELRELKGRFSGTTMGGGITLTRVEGVARLTTMGGEVTVTDCDIDGYIKTMGGEVLMKDVVGYLDASSMGGDVRYVNVRDREGDIRASGGLLARGLDEGTVTITTMGGDIEVDDAPAGAVVHTMGGDIKIVNADRLVKAKTLGGSIEIDIHEGWVKAMTMAGDIDVTVAEGLGGGSEGIILESMSGDVTLTIPSGLDAKFDLMIAYTRNSRKDYEIKSNLDLEITRSDEWDYNDGTPKKRIHAKGVMGRGSIPIRIETVNGDIHVDLTD